MRRATIIGFALMVMVGVMLCGSVWADGMTEEPPGLVIEVAAAQTGGGGGSPAPGKIDLQTLAERVETLEKENLVLREDLGKARLDGRTDLSALERRQAEKIAELNARLDKMQAEMAADRAAQKRRNRDLLFAIGAVAIGLLVTD